MAGIGESSYRRFPQGRENEIENIVFELSDELVRFGFSFVRSEAVAEDLTADAIASMIVRRKKFDSPQRMLSYLYKTVRSRCLDYLRRNKKHISMEDLAEISGGTDPQAIFLQKERNRILYAALWQMKVQYREVLWLTYLEELPIAEVCTIVGKNKKQVYNLLSRAKSSLKAILEKEGITYEDL